MRREILKPPHRGGFTLHLTSHPKHYKQCLDKKTKQNKKHEDLAQIHSPQLFGEEDGREAGENH